MPGRRKSAALAGGSRRGYLRRTHCLRKSTRVPVTVGSPTKAPRRCRAFFGGLRQCGSDAGAAVAYRRLNRRGTVGVQVHAHSTGTARVREYSIAADPLSALGLAASEWGCSAVLRRGVLAHSAVLHLDGAQPPRSTHAVLPQCSHRARWGDRALTCDQCRAEPRRPRAAPRGAVVAHPLAHLQ